jgi:aminoglycoside 3-N-acetyltransferase
VEHWQSADLEVALLTKSEIASGLRQLGVAPGMNLMLHSSLRALGGVVDGPRAVIEALKEILTPDGTLLMPSFNHGAPYQVGDIYDPLTTPTENGAVADQFWRLEDVHRSLNPTHPFAAWGSNAKRYVEHHHAGRTMGPESPLGLLAADGGHQLNLGTTHQTTTAKHLAETLVGAPCLGVRTEALDVLVPGSGKRKLRTWSYRGSQCPLTESGELIDAAMVQQRLQKSSGIGLGSATLFKVADLIGVVQTLLRQGHATHPPCSRCSIRPQHGPFTVASDWQSPQPRSLRASLAGG